MFRYHYWGRKIYPVIALSCIIDDFAALDIIDNLLAIHLLIKLGGPFFLIFIKYQTQTLRLSVSLGTYLNLKPNIHERQGCACEVCK